MKSRIPLQFCAIVLALTGCASSPTHDLENVRIGMDKDRVLETAGSPQRTFREAMKDHWVYVYYTDNKEWQREIVFSDGMVSRITQPAGPNSLDKSLENSESMEEYEKAARDHQKKAEHFKPVDGDSEHNKSDE